MEKNKTDEAWSDIQNWINIARASGRQIEVTTSNSDSSSILLQKTNDKENSYLDAIFTHTGGVLVDYGWLRILGSGSEVLPRSINSQNISEITKNSIIDQVILFGDDVLGGFFAINNGGFKGSIGEVYYFAPDTLEWEGLDISISNFLKWVFSDNFDEFYSIFRWKNWEVEVQNISTIQVLSIYPPLWSEDSSIEFRSRKAVPIEEVYDSITKK